jgi:hypothetical protein
MKPAPTAQQWALLHRMQAGGCPIDFGNLNRPSGPIEVVNRPSTLGNVDGSNLFVRQGRSWLALYLKLHVIREVNLESLRVQAHWLGGGLSLLGTCPDHKGRFCLPLNTQGQHVGFDSSRGLNSFLLRHDVLRPGTRLEGYLLAVGPDFPARGAAEYLDAQICLDTFTGQEMAFPVVVVNRPMDGWG